MTNGKISNFYEHKPASGAKPRQMVLLLHGLGADGRDLLSLAPLFAQDLPEAVFISPDAPFACDMAPMGYQWFSLREWTAESILQGIKMAAPILNDFINEHLQRFDIKSESLALVGFSQGTMMSLYAGPRYPEPIAGILGYSGALSGGDELGLKPGAFRKMPIHLIHGEADNVVPVDAWHHARDALGHAGFMVTGYTTAGLMHGIDEEGILSGREFLKSVLS